MGDQFSPPAWLYQELEKAQSLLPRPIFIWAIIWRWPIFFTPGPFFDGLTIFMIIWRQPIFFARGPFCPIIFFALLCSIRRICCKLLLLGIKTFRSENVFVNDIKRKILCSKLLKFFVLAISSIFIYNFFLQCMYVYIMHGSVGNYPGIFADLIVYEDAENFRLHVVMTGIFLCICMQRRKSR